MNYARIYKAIIDNRIASPFNGYGENHHIIPKSVGGSNEPSNIVRLTAREHFLCHYLLSKMYPKGSEEEYRLAYAFGMMTRINQNQNGERYINAGLYELAKVRLNNIAKGSRWIHNPSTQQTKMLPKSSELLPGWRFGRYSKLSEDPFDAHNRFYQIYVVDGFEAVQSQGYPYCYQHFLGFCRKHLDEYTPRSRLRKNKE